MNSTENRRVAAYVIGLTASVINGTPPPENDGLSWSDIIEFASKQCVLNLVSYAVEDLQNKPDGQTLKYLREFRMQKIVVEAQQELAALDACEMLEKSAVRHILLKGSVIKGLYPSPDMRTMGDIDILIDRAQLEKVKKLFLNEGFELVGEGDLHSNVRKGNAYIELHQTMVDPDLKILTEYYGDGFRLAQKCSGKEYEYELSHEDFFVFLIAHIAKHYRYGGIGLRALLDLYVFRKNLPQLDRNYINAELQKIGLDVFAEKINRIASDWFSGSFDGEFNTMSEYIISGGVYGIDGTPVQNEFILKNIDGNIRRQKAKSVLSVIFPSLGEMQIRYPVLKKEKFLLPVFWVIRFFDTLRFARKNIHGRMENAQKIISIDSKMIEIQKISGIKEL